MPSHDPGVTELLRLASDDLRPDVDRLVSGGISRGRTRRRRARIGTTVAALAVIGVVGVLAAVVPRPDASDRAREPDRVADSTPTPTLSTSVPPAAIERGLADLPPAGVPDVVDEILGTGLAQAPRPGDTVVGDRDEKLAYFPYDGMQAAVGLQLNQLLTVARCEEVNYHLGGACTELPDGTVQLTWGPTLADGVTCQGVSAYRHGYVVWASSCNASESKDSPPLSPEPPISLEQLGAIATSDVWFG